MPVSRSTSASWIRVRHASAVATLIAAPLAGVAWSVTVPLFRGSMAIEVANIAMSVDRFVAGTYLGLLMSFLMVPALLAIARLLRPSAPVASDVAMTVGAAGACFHGALLVFQLAEAAIIAAIPERDVATTVVSRMFEHRAFSLVLAPFILFYVGLAAFAVLLLLRRVVPAWIPALYWCRSRSSWLARSSGRRACSSAFCSSRSAASRWSCGASARQSGRDAACHPRAIWRTLHWV